MTLPLWQKVKRGKQTRGAGGSLSGAGMKERGPCLIPAPSPHPSGEPWMGPRGGLIFPPPQADAGDAPCGAHQGRGGEG